ncbi:MAG: PEP-CTERM sorting domain-containing protein [Verrucomicrobiaceae bacterium]
MPVVSGIVGFLVISQSCWGYLGGFETEDGYQRWLNHVERYNAGQYGTNVGSGTLTNYSSGNYGSGLWRKISGSSSMYASGHHGRDRLTAYDANLNWQDDATRKALVIVTDNAGWDEGAQIYEYSFDALDLGVNPVDTAGQTVELTFWSCPADFSNGLPAEGFYGDTVELMDSSGNVGVSVGYHLDSGSSSPTYAYNINGSWVDTNVAVPTSYYHSWDITLNLATGKVDVGYTDGGYSQYIPATNGYSSKGTGTQVSLLSNVDMYQTMTNLTDMRLTSAPGVQNGKYWQLDDFSFNTFTPVPEPGSVTLAMFSLMALVGRRR